MTNEFINFYNKNTGKLITGISLNGFYHDELKPTIELLAYENGLQVENISFKIENMKGVL